MISSEIKCMRCELTQTHIYMIKNEWWNTKSFRAELQSGISHLPTIDRQTITIRQSNNFNIYLLLSGMNEFSIPVVNIECKKKNAHQVVDGWINNQNRSMPISVKFQCGNSEQGKRDRFHYHCWWWENCVFFGIWSDHQGSLRSFCKLWWAAFECSSK